MSEFKVGDKVKIIKKVEGLSDEWMDEMDNLLGESGVVYSSTDGDAAGVRSLEGDEVWNFYFPDDALELSHEEPKKVVSESNTNPKAAIGSKSLPLTSLSPFIALYGCLGKLNGQSKYGAANYVGTEVVMSIYLDAIQRHFDKIRAGEEVDAMDGVPHWSAIIANIDIILSARAAATLIDDRPLIMGYQEEVAKLTPIVASLQELHKEKNPKHYYLKDAK